MMWLHSHRMHNQKLKNNWNSTVHVQNLHQSVNMDAETLNWL